MTASVLCALHQGIHSLKENGVLDPKESAEDLLSHAIKRPKHFIYVESDSYLSEKEESLFFDLIKKRAKRFPLQYLTGKATFRSVDLKIEEGVFIPRPETELLVETILSHFGKEKNLNPRILEIGTGSGCIAVSLAVEIDNCRIVATDKSQAALSLAKENAVRNQVSEKIEFVKSNDWDQVSGQFDFLVSNPPYLSEKDLSELQPEVSFEPKLALRGGEEGLDPYFRMIPSLHQILKPNGFVAFEVGLGQAELVAELLEKNQFVDICKTKDFSGIERIVSALSS